MGMLGVMAKLRSLPTVIGISAVLAGGVTYWATSNYYQAQEAKAVKAALEEANRVYQADIEAMQDSAETVEVLRTVIKYVDRKAENVETPECTDLGDDFVGLLNRSIEAANHTGQPTD